VTTISSIVEQSIREKPFLEDALVRGIINYSSLAEEMVNEIAKIKGVKPEEISSSAIMMALRRSSDRLKKKFQASLKDKITFENTDLRIIYDLFEITVRREPQIMKKIESLYQLIDFPGGDFLTITHGMYEITIISNKRYKERIKSIFETDEIIAMFPELASLSIKIPESAINLEGLFYMITKSLFMEGISIFELVSTYTEMIIILKDYDIPNATTCVRSLIAGYS
jgi:hypothetical protein